MPKQVIIIMGSGAEAVHETVEASHRARARKVGVLKVRLYRPFSVEHFLQALPKTVKSIAVLDRTKEPGSIGEPLYQDVVTALMEGFTAAKAPMATFPKVIGGRYGLSSKEFTPAMVVRIFDELKKRGSARTTSPSASKTTSPTPASTTIPTSLPKTPRPCAPCSGAWALTVRSARTRTPSRSSAKKPTCTCRATSCTTPRSRAR